MLLYITDDTVKQAALGSGRSYGLNTWARFAAADYFTSNGRRSGPG